MNSYYPSISFASCSIWALFSSVIAERIFTSVSAKLVFLQLSSIPFIIFAAVGAQLPFSIRPIFRFWYPRSVRCSMNYRMNGKMSAL